MESSQVAISHLILSMLIWFGGPSTQLNAQTEDRKAKVEMHQKMAATHQKMAQCLQGNKSEQDCRAEMMKNCPMKESKNCPMMHDMISAGHPAHGHAHGDHGPKDAPSGQYGTSSTKKNQ